MKKLNSEEIKSELLNMLVVFDRFCKENQLRYYLVGGTLLGAIRHHGFIPWDDDIDVCMPRPDYEKMKNLRDRFPDGYRLDNYWHKEDAPYEKLLNLSLPIKTGLLKDVEYLWIDILPTDGLPASEEETEKIYKKEDTWRRILKMHQALYDKGKTKFGRMIKHAEKNVMRSIFTTDRCISHMNAIARTYDYQNSDYVGNITWGLYGKGERMLKSEFEVPVSVSFEGCQFPTFQCWDSYLKGIYGDYMKLPPVEKRGTHKLDVWKNEN